MKLDYSQQIFEKYPNIKFHDNLSSRSQVVPCRQTDRTELTVIFRNSVYAPKNFTLVQSEASDTNDLHLAHANYMTGILDFN